MPHIGDFAFWHPNTRRVKVIPRGFIYMQIEIRMRLKDAGGLLLSGCGAINVFRIASAFTAKGTQLTMVSQRMICCTVMEMACLGTKSRLSNHPSLTC